VRHTRCTQQALCRAKREQCAAFFDSEIIRDLLAAKRGACTSQFETIRRAATKRTSASPRFYDRATLTFRVGHPALSIGFSFLI